ncbi:MAG: amidase family protein, partial [Dehalococcoidia bacterium]
TLRNVDVLLTPTTPSAAPRDLSTTGSPVFQGPWTTAGLPTISLPSGLNGSGLPLGIQLVSPWFAEATLLAVARWCEAALDVNLAPPGE